MVKFNINKVFILSSEVKRTNEEGRHLVSIFGSHSIRRNKPVVTKNNKITYEVEYDSETYNFTIFRATDKLVNALTKGRILYSVEGHIVQNDRYNNFIIDNFVLGEIKEPHQAQPQPQEVAITAPETGACFDDTDVAF